MSVATTYCCRHYVKGMGLARRSVVEVHATVEHMLCRSARECVHIRNQSPVLSQVPLAMW